MDHSTALKFVKWIQKHLKIDGKKCYSIPVGSLRRKESRHTDIDLLIVADSFGDLTLNGKLITHGGAHHKTTKIIEPTTGKRIHIDLFLTRKEDLPFALFHYTGSKIYNIRTRAKAKRAGYKLNQYGLFKNEKKINFRSEYELMKFLGLTLRKPEDRY
jgi:DNA polymerase (family 10)